MTKKSGKAKPSSHLPKQAPKRTGKAGIKPLDNEESEQAELLKMPEQPKPPAVQGNKILAHFIRPHFRKTKAGERLIALELSFPLTDAHEEFIPKAVRDGWKFMAKKGNKRLDIVDVPNQFARFYLASDDKSEALILPVSQITHVSLAVVKQTGTGAATKVIRFSFRLEVKMSAEVGRFADANFDESFWLEMAETQETLFDEDGE